MNNQNLFQRIKSSFMNHKIWSTIIFIVILFGVYYFFFRSVAGTEMRYVTSTVEKGSVVVSVSGTGQIESSDTVNINAKTTGEIVSVPVKVGQMVSRGSIIASVDSSDARISLETMKLSLDKLKKPNTLTVLQKENSLKKIYDNSWNSIAPFISDMNTVITGLDSLNNGYLGYQNRYQLSNTGKGKLDISEKEYWEAKKSYDATVLYYKSLSRSSSNEDIDKLLNRALETAKIISNTVKLTQASFDYTYNYLDQSGTSAVINNQTNLSSWTSTTNDYVNSLISSLNTNAETVQSLKEALSPADELDIRQAELNVETKQNALNDCFIRAPFDGIVATLTAKVGQSASGSIGTLIAKQKIVKIALNEVDIAKIKLGQKATLSFDAIDGLTITGSVDGIDSVGTVSSGVVTYNVTISLDIDDSRVKPGMSVSASVITDTASDVVIVPNSAVKNQNGVNYVEVFSAPLSTPDIGTQGSVSSVLPTQVEVTVGLVDDISSQIISGLKVGDIIVTKTITSSASKTTTTPSILNAVGGSKAGASGGGAMRVIGAH